MIVIEKQEYKEAAAMAASGDVAAFRRLYETVYEEMYYAAYYSLKSEGDAIDVITGTIRDGFAAVGRLRSESAFRTFMMKNLCSRIRAQFKAYSKNGAPQSADNSTPIKREFDRLADLDRLVTSLYVAGKFMPNEISAFTGMSAGAVKKKLARCIDEFSLD